MEKDAGRRRATRRRRRPRVAIVDPVYPDFKLTDKRWNATAAFAAKAAGLADFPASAAPQARNELEAVIGKHRLQAQRAMLWNANRAVLAAIRDEIRAARKGCEQLAERLPPDWSAPFLKDAKVLRLLEAHYGSIADEQDFPRKRGPATGADYVLINYLIGFLDRYTGVSVQSSNKSIRHFLEYLCKIANPNIGWKTIERAMLSCIDHRGQPPAQAAAAAEADWHRKANKRPPSPAGKAAALDWQRNAERTMLELQGKVKRNTSSPVEHAGLPARRRQGAKA